MRFWPLIIGVVLLCGVGTTSAEEIHLWNFRDNMPYSTRSEGLEAVQKTPEGLYVRSTKEGFLLWENQPITRSTDVITLRVRSKTNVYASLVWLSNDASVQGPYQYRFLIPASDLPIDVHISLNDYSIWNWRTNVLAIRFEAGTELVLQEITFRSWTPMEKLIEGFKSFWTFDDFRAYSINFLWGPLITTTGPGRDVLFADLPPPAWSAMRVVYALIACSAAIGLGIGLLKNNRALALGVVSATVLVLWVVLDVRMGAELLSYAVDDVRSYVQKTGMQKVLRTHQNTYAIIDAMLPTIAQHKRYALYSQAQTPFYPNLRYQAFPSVPVLEGQNTTGVKLWVVYGRPDIQLDEQRRLTRAADPEKFPGGIEVLSPPGRIALSIDPGVFLFIADE